MTSMKIKVNFVSLIDEKIAFLTPVIFAEKDAGGFMLAISWLFWGVGFVFTKKEYEPK